MIDLVKHLHSRLLTRRADDRVRVDSAYCLNAANDEASLFTVVGYLSPCRDRIDAIMSASSRYEETQIPKNRDNSRLVRSNCLSKTVATSLSRAAYAKFELIIY